MKYKNILYVTSECSGFASSGGLAEVAGSLPQAIQNAKKSYKVKVVMPLYKKIVDTYQSELKYIGNENVVLAWRNLYCGLFTMKKNGIDYYFIDNKYYFDRDNLYGYLDDGERFAFFSKAVFAMMDILKYHPDIIHCNDWHSALVNIYLDVMYKKQGYMMDVKSIFTIHNIEYQGIFGMDFLENVIGIDGYFTGILEYNGLVNLIKGAIVCSDLVTTVSPRYARELQTAQFACGLENIIRLNNNKMVGIINGINTELYDPATDKFIAFNYNSDDFSNKEKNKEELQKELGLEVDPNKCMISFIARLVSHKGIDLVLERFGDIMKENVQFVLLGMGDEAYQNKLKEFAYYHQDKARIIIDYNNALSRRIYAASDLFLMPSKFEPCGLSQMIASRYGAFPIVRATGGLYDSIKDWQNGEGNGFVFRDYNSYDMLNKIKEAIYYYYNKEERDKIIKKVMTTDFSWNASAVQYIEVYNNLLKK